MQALFEHYKLKYDDEKMVFACHYYISNRETTISFGSRFNDTSIDPLVIRLSLDQQADLQANTRTTHQLLERERYF